MNLAFASKSISPEISPKIIDKNQYSNLSKNKDLHNNVTQSSKVHNITVPINNNLNKSDTHIEIQKFSENTQNSTKLASAENLNNR